MRVAFLTNFISPYLAPVLEALAERVTNLCVMVSTSMEPNRPWSAPSTRLHVVAQKTWTLPGLWRHPRGFEERLFVHVPMNTVRDLQRFRPEVIISVEMGARTLLASLYRLLNRRTALLVWADVAESTEHGRGWLRHVARFLIQHSVDLFITNGCSGGRYLRKLGIPRHRICEIPYAIETALFSRCPATRPPALSHSLLFVGQLIERKGLRPFLSALNEWAGTHPDRSVTLDLVGDGPLRTSLEKFSANKNLLIKFHGNVSYEDTVAFYARAGILILPTWADTWGLVVNEAMASGVPVLGSLYSQAVEELVKEGSTGWCFRPDKQAEMMDAIDRALQTPRDRLDEMRLEARAAAMALNPERVADMITSALEKTICQQPRARLALLTNIVAPYRLPVYRQIAKNFELRVFIAGKEDNRGAWADGVGAIPAKRSWGWTFRKVRQMKGEVFDLSYLHITPGYLVDLIRSNPRIIISNEMGMRTCIAVVYGLLFHVPVWVWWGGTCHTERVRSIGRRLLRRALAHIVKGWISYGQTSTEYLESLGVRSATIIQIQNCIDEARYKSVRHTSSTPSSVRLLCVSQLLARKGIGELLRAFAEVSRDNGEVLLTIVGDGPERLRLEALASQLGIASVRFAGLKTPDEILDYYAEADCLVFPTLEDVWGLVVNEALWANVPVICSKYAGCAREILPDAALFDPLDHDDFVQALARAARRDFEYPNRERLRTAESVGEQIVAAISARVPAVAVATHRMRRE